MESRFLQTKKVTKMNSTFLSISLSSFPKLSPFFQVSHTYTTKYVSLKNSFFSKSFNSIFRSSEISNLNLNIRHSSFSYTLNSAICLSSAKKTVTKQKFSTQQVFKIVSQTSFDHCSFYKCSSIDTKGGGAVLCNNVDGEISFMHSSFVECISTQSMSNGGAIAITESKLNMDIRNVCFEKCTASISGQAIFVKSSHSSMKVESTSFYFCYRESNKMQTATFDHNCCFEGSCLNTTTTNCPRTPAFRSRVQDTVYLNEYLTLYNLTCDKFAAIYEISINGKNVNTQIQKWNVVSCKGNYKEMGQYKAKTEIIHKDSTFRDNNMKLFFSIMMGKVIFDGIISDVQIVYEANYAKYVDVGCIITENVQTYEIPIKYSEVCWISKGNHDFSFVISKPVLIVAAILIMGVLFFFCSIGNCILYFVSRRRMKYTLLAVPDISD